MAKWYPIRPSARESLTASVAYDGPRVTITDQLGSPVWREVKAVLERLGAVYVVGSSAFEFEPDQDAHAIVTAALDAGRVMGVANAAGFVPTPAGVAADLVAEFAELTAGGGDPLTVLEPSAGTGRFVAAITRGLGPAWLRVTAVEPDQRRARQIPTDGGQVDVVVDTFEQVYQRAVLSGQRWDRVVMNPPFAVPGAAYLWARHLLMAWDLLAPGGRLVAIVPATCADRRNATRVAVVRDASDLVHQHGGSATLDVDTFAESGIVVPTVAVWLDRPVTAGGTATLDLPAYVARPYTGDEPTVDVSRLILTRGAGAATPVQRWRDAWRNAVRTCRYRGECILCARPVWGFDDGENDPRGVLGDNAPDLLDPAEQGYEGMLPVVACFLCMNDSRETYERAWVRARGYWATVGSDRQAVPAGGSFVSGWATMQPVLSGV